MIFATVPITCCAALGSQDGSAHQSRDQAVELIRLMTEDQLSATEALGMLISALGRRTASS